MPQWKASAEECKGVGCGVWGPVVYEYFVLLSLFIQWPDKMQSRQFWVTKSKKEEQATEPRTYANIEMADIRART